jgi:hypothetical protein
MTQHSLTQLSNSSAIRLTPNGLHGGMDITVQNVDSNAYVFIGGEGVNSESYGYRIAPNNAISFSLLAPDALYAISDTNGTYIAVIQVGILS